MGAGMNELRGLSCAHVLRGADWDVHAESPVWLWRGETENLKAGHTLRAFDTTGSGASDDYGFDDAVSFTVDAAWTAAESSSLRQFRITDVGEDEERLSAITGRGVMDGDVRGVNMEYGVWYCDYLINVDYPGSYDGDSGSLWCSADGRGVAIHARGGEDYANKGSRLSAAMSVTRILKKFGVSASQLRVAPRSS